MEMAIKVQGMHCKSCEALLKEVVEEAGGKVILADHRKGIMKVNAEESALPMIKGVIEKEGYKVVG